jgi:hypothetical protein
MVCPLYYPLRFRLSRRNLNWKLSFDFCLTGFPFVERKKEGGTKGTHLEAYNEKLFNALG